MLCFPALAQTADTVATPPAGWFWTVQEWRPTLSSSDGRFTMSIRARYQLDAGWFDQSQDVGASLLMAIPVMVVYIYAQRYLVEGLSLGAVKG